MGGSVAVIADSHIGGPGGPAEPLVAQLEELAAEGCRRLVLLGDLFHVWVGDPRYETPEIRRVAEVLRAIRGPGLRIDYVEGNRDFFIADGPYAELFDAVTDEIVFTAGGRRFLAVHGDGLDDRDRKYRFWRWLSKSRASRFLMRRLPRSIAHLAVHGTERRLARTNFKHKSRIPEEVILRYAAGRLAGEHEVLLFGHFHEPRTWQIEQGEVRLLDAWFRSRRVEWLD